MSLFRSLSGLFTSAFESPPPIIVAASRSLSLSSADDAASSSSSASRPTSATAKPEVKSSSSKPAPASGGRDAIPEVDLSHLSVEERETIAAVLARASSADATRSDSDVDRQVLSSHPRDAILP